MSNKALNIYKSVVCLINKYGINNNDTSLCLDAGITPSTVFDFMVGKSKCPKVPTLKKFCQGAGITLKEFFDRSYFDDEEDFD